MISEDHASRRRPVFPFSAMPNQTSPTGFSGRATVRAGNAGDGERDAGAGVLQRAGCHFVGRFGGHCAVFVERLLRDAEHVLLRLVGIGDEAPVNHRRRSGDVGQQRDDQCRPCRISAVATRIFLARAGFQEPVRQVALIIMAHPEPLPERCTLAVAMAAIPSSRPMKPRRSLVVALTEMRPSMRNIFSIDAMAHHGRAVRADARRFADQSDVGIGDATAARHARTRPRAPRRGARPRPSTCGSEGGKCVPMSPAAAGGEQRVGERMQADIRVGVAGQFLSCGIFTPQSQTWSPASKECTS